MPPKLVRNLSRVRCAEFFEQGKLRLKPVAAYKDIEDESRVDEREGARGIIAKPSTNITGLADKLWSPSNISIKGTKDGAAPLFFFGAGSSVSFIEVIPQAYVLCLSERRHPKFGDAAFSIGDVMLFGERLFRALNAQEKTLAWRLAKVRYGEHKDTVTDQVEFDVATKKLAATDYSEGYFTKPSKYADEFEWRYVFVVEDQEQPLNDIDIFDKSLVECCEHMPPD